MTKHCPFCGLLLDYDDDDCIYPINRERTIYNLVCYEIGGGCGASVLGTSREDAIRRWETRATTPHIGCKPFDSTEHHSHDTENEIEQARRLA